MFFAAFGAPSPPPRRVLIASRPRRTLKQDDDDTNDEYGNLGISIISLFISWPSNMFPSVVLGRSIKEHY